MLGVLDTLTSIFERYPYLPKGQKLWEEIKYVVTLFQEPFLVVFKRVVGAVAGNMSNDAVLVQLFKVITALTKIYYLLNSQDIIEYFEDHLGEVMEPFQQFLTFQHAALESKIDDEPGVLDELKKEICQVVNLFTNKYDEVFEKWTPLFVNDIWNLLSALDHKERYDALVTTAVKFLTSVVKKEWHKSFFSSEVALKTICENIVVPQLKLRESDVELFQMDALEYIRRDIEGSDIDTRRRTTVDFVRGLCVHFESEISTLLKQYVGVLLQQYASNPAQHWVDKDAAMYVILALTVRGSTTAKGATKINQYINVVDFFGTQVLPELQAADVDERPVLKADCLKFVATFRQHLPKEAYVVLLPLLVRFLQTETFVLHTYAANAIDKLLSVRDGDTTQAPLRMSSADLQSSVEPMLTALFGVLEKYDESAENQYIMLAILRVCSCVDAAALQGMCGVILGKLTAILAKVSQNPRSPVFNHNLFETIACLVGTCATAQNEAMVAAFETALFPPFQTMLGMETCREFGPYVFQILAQLLEARTVLSPAYTAIFPALLMPMVWENNGNVPPLVRLLQAYLTKEDGIALVVSKLEGVLGVFHKLISSKRVDQHGLQLLGSLTTYIPLQQLQQYLNTVFSLLFQRLQSSKTPQFSSSLAVFLSLFVTKHGVAPLQQLLTALQPGMFGMVVEKVWLASLPLIHNASAKQTAVVGCVAMLANDGTLLQQHAALWPKFFDAVITLIEGAKALSAAGGFKANDTAGPASTAETADDLMQESAKGFNTAFSKLAFAQRNAKLHGTSQRAAPNNTNDGAYAVPVVADTRAHVAMAMATMAKQLAPGQLVSLVQQMQPPCQQALQSYLVANNVSLG
jgi:exportin-2 (importin alpha re-exporter)